MNVLQVMAGLEELWEDAPFEVDIDKSSTNRVLYKMKDENKLDMERPVAGKPIFSLPRERPVRPAGPHREIPDDAEIRIYCDMGTAGCHLAFLQELASRYKRCKFLYYGTRTVNENLGAEPARDCWRFTQSDMKNAICVAMCIESAAHVQEINSEGSSACVLFFGKNKLLYTAECELRPHCEYVRCHAEKSSLRHSIDYLLGHT